MDSTRKGSSVNGAGGSFFAVNEKIMPVKWKRGKDTKLLLVIMEQLLYNINSAYLHAETDLLCGKAIR